MKRINNHRVLVTGGAGFIGSNLCEDLLKHGNEIICLDNFITGKFYNIQSLLSNANFKLIVGDIRNPEDCKAAVDGVDYVFHQAALGSVPRSVNNPANTHEHNATGTLNMLVAARDANVKRFVYASSSSVYGDSTTLPKVEGQEGTPLSPYAISKKTGELYAQCLSKLFPTLQTVGLRYFNVFGRRQNPEGPYAAVIPAFIKSLMQHQSPVIYGDGEQSRDFTYIDNVIAANHLAALAENPEAINRAYNIACGTQITLQSLLEMITDLLCSFDPAITKIVPCYKPSRPGDIKHSYASIGSATKMLDYHPAIELKEGLKQSISWYWKNSPAQTETVSNART